MHTQPDEMPFHSLFVVSEFPKQVERNFSKRGHISAFARFSLGHSELLVPSYLTILQTLTNAKEPSIPIPLSHSRGPSETTKATW